MDRVEPRASGVSFLVIATGAVLLVLGLVMAAGGARLIALGGSIYYVTGGLTLILVALTLFLRHPAALPLYASFLFATTIWAVAEVRFDWWQLVPRLALWWLIGAWLALPWMYRRLRNNVQSNDEDRRPAGTVFLWLALAVAAGAGIVGGFTDYDDRPGQLAMNVVAPSPIDSAATERSGDWPSYGGSLLGQRYSPLSQITAQNVANLKVAWIYQTGDRPGPDDPTEITDENTPLKIGNSLYLCTPHSKLIALDVNTGKERWRFDPRLVSIEGFKHFEHMTCRGVSYYEESTDAKTESSGASISNFCVRRLFLPTADARLLAINADTGRPCDDFGDKGTVSLRTSIGPFKPGSYYSTSPAIVARGLVIIGGHVSDNVSNDEPSGVIRAFDVHNGRLVWNWDPGEPNRTEPIAPGEIYTRNSPNVWSIASADEKLGLLYLPMGNQTPDQWGGQRTPQSERLSAGIVALDIETGKLRWSYQFTHHDLWDMDVGGQPTLADLVTAQGTVPALIASTKQGSIYVLDRRNGRAVVPILEVPRPQTNIADDHTAPTQPMSALSFSPTKLRESDMWGSNPYDQLWCRIRFRSLRYEGMFTPPSTQGSLIYPGNFGVFDWGGISVDPRRQLLIANPNYMAFTSRLIPKQNAQGASTMPTSEQLSKKRSIGTTIWNFLSWAGTPVDKEATSENSGIKKVQGIPYDIELLPFLSPLGIPCQAPPWGYVAGVDLGNHRIVWQHKNGTSRDSSPIPLPFPLGVPSLGGTIVTAGGVAFLSGTLDYYVRAYDVSTGAQLWKSRLPAGGQATPMSYADADGKQYLIVTAGGHGSLGTKAGDYVIAYALP